MYQTINWKRVIINLVALALIITIALLYFFTDIFRTKRGAFYKYFNNIPTMLKVVDSNDYADYKKAKKQYAYTREAEMTIQSSENYADSNILDKIKYVITSNVNDKAGRMSTDIEIKNGNNSVNKTTIRRDKEVYGIYNPEIVTGYVVVKNNGLENVWKALDVDYASQIIMFNIDEFNDISKTEKKHLSDFFKLIKQVPNTSYQKERNKDITIDGEEYTANAYILDLDEEETKELEIQLIDKLKSDSILMNYFTSKMRLLNLGEDYTDINMFNQKLNTRMSKLQSGELKEKPVKITIYENKRNNIRTEIKYGDDTYILENIIKDDSQKVSFKKNDEYTYKIGRKENEHYIYVENNSDLKQSVEITYHQEGNLNDNTVSNVATIVRTEGIKKVTYLYKDKVKFSNDVVIPDIDLSLAVILTDYKEESIRSFFKDLKVKINKVYVQKGAEIGISLDPIFK